MFLHTGPLQRSRTAEKSPSFSNACLFPGTLQRASPFGLGCAEHDCSCVRLSRQPIVGALVIRIRTHLLLKPSQALTNGSEISWGHIKASHAPGCAAKEHRRDGVTLFLRPLLVLFTWLRGGRQIMCVRLGRCLNKYTLTINRHKQSAHSSGVKGPMFHPFSYLQTPVEQPCKLIIKKTL